MSVKHFSQSSDDENDIYTKSYETITIQDYKHQFINLIEKNNDTLTSFDPKTRELEEANEYELYVVDDFRFSVFVKLTQTWHFEYFQDENDDENKVIEILLRYCFICCFSNYITSPNGILKRRMLKHVIPIYYNQLFSAVGTKSEEQIIKELNNVEQTTTTICNYLVSLAVRSDVVVVLTNHLKSLAVDYKYILMYETLCEKLKIPDVVDKYVSIFTSEMVDDILTSTLGDAIDEDLNTTREKIADAYSRSVQTQPPSKLIRLILRMGEFQITA